MYTDGACSGNPGPGGWAWAVPGGEWASGADPATTNQRMELTAALEAMRSVTGPIEIRSDSTYVVNCVKDRWYEGWRRRGWTNAKKQPVANQHLWKPFVELYLARRDEVTFSWVKGHSGDVMNDYVDRLAVAACLAQEGRHGDAPLPLDEAGPTDELPRGPGKAGPTSAATAGGGGRALPPGHGVLVCGHKPTDLGGYDGGAVADAVRAQLVERLRWLARAQDDLFVVTGLQLGADQLGAEAAVEAGVPFAAVLAFPHPDVLWPEPSRKRFAELAGRAAAVVTLETKPPATRPAAGQALRRRDDWLARNVAEAIVVWDGEEPLVGRRHAALVSALGADNVTQLRP